MRVKDIMMRDAKSCRMHTNLAAVAAIMWNNGCGALPVVDDGNKVIGMITDRDVCIAAGTRNWVPSDIKVSNVVPARAYTCSPEDDVHVALNTMRTQKVRRLPVTAPDGKLHGILCLDDIAQSARKGDSLTYEDAIETWKAICQRPLPQKAFAA